MITVHDSVGEGPELERGINTAQVSLVAHRKPPFEVGLIILGLERL